MSASTPASEAGEWPDWAVFALRLLSSVGRDTNGYGFPTPPSEEVLDILRARRVDSLYNFGLLASEPPASQALYQRVFDEQRRAIAELAEAAATTGLYFCVVKGAEIFERYFRGRPLSFINDIDVLIDPRQTASAKCLLHGLGYVQGAYDREAMRLVPSSVSDIAKHESVHFELAPFCKLRRLEVSEREVEIIERWNWSPISWTGSEAHLIVEFDVHHGLASDLPVDPLIARWRPSAFDGAKTPDPADHLWYVTAKYYTEVGYFDKKSLRELAYIGALLHDPALDWDRIVSAAVEHDLFPSLYYFLTVMNELTGEPIERRLLRKLHPAHGTRRRDLGWQIGRLLDGVDPYPLADMGL